jgi:hypothetical protein
VTGDLVNKAGDSPQIAAYLRATARLNGSIPLYNVPGNHDLENVPTPESIDAYVAKFGPDRYSFRVGTMAGLVAKYLLYKKGVEIVGAANFSDDREVLEAHSKDGTLVALYAKVIADMGAYFLFDGAGNAFETMKSVYRCPNVKLEGYSVYTNKPQGGRMRCVGHPMPQFAQEVHMDVIAEKLGMDPVEFRLKNYARFDRSGEW